MPFSLLFTIELTNHRCYYENIYFHYLWTCAIGLKSHALCARHNRDQPNPTKTNQSVLNCNVRPTHIQHSMPAVMCIKNIESIRYVEWNFIHLRTCMIIPWECYCARIFPCAILIPHFPFVHSFVLVYVKLILLFAIKRLKRMARSHMKCVCMQI